MHVSSIAHNQQVPFHYNDNQHKAVELQASSILKNLTCIFVCLQYLPIIISNNLISFIILQEMPHPTIDDFSDNYKQSCCL